MISADLVQSLLDSETHLSSTLAAAPDSAGTEPTRQYAHRKLNSMVPEAIETLELGLNCGEIKDRVAAAEKVLKFAPATNPESALAPPAFNLPASAIELLTTGISRMFSALIPAPQPLQSQQERLVYEEVHAIEVPSVKAKDAIEEAVIVRGQKPKAKVSAAAASKSKNKTQVSKPKTAKPKSRSSSGKPSGAKKR